MEEFEGNDNFSQVNEILKELEEEEVGFEDSPITVNLLNVKAEGVYVYGVRKSPVVVTFSNTVERDPDRDAAELEAKLAHLLDEKTFTLLCEKLYRNYIQPKIEMANYFESALRENLQKAKSKKKPDLPKEPND